MTGLWVFITLLPTLLVNRTKRNDKLTLLDYTGFIVWFVGFLFEVVADHQKLMFKLDPETSVSLMVLFYHLLTSLLRIVTEHLIDWADLM